MDVNDSHREREDKTMATTTETNGTATKDTRRGFPGLTCIECGEVDCVQVNLENMHFTCSSCSEEFTAKDVREMMASWGRVLDWIEMAPTTK